MKISKIIIFMLSALIFMSCIVLINTINFNKNIRTNTTSFTTTNLQAVNIDSKVPIFLRSNNGGKIVIKCHLNKNFHPYINLKNKGMIIRYNDILNNVRRTMRFGGDNEFIIISIPKKDKIRNIQLRADRGIRVNHMIAHRICMNDVFGDVHLSSVSTKGIRIHNKFGDIFLKNIKYSKKKITHKFGDIYWI